MNGPQTSLPVSEIVRGAQVDLARMRLGVSWDCATGWNVKPVRLKTPERPSDTSLDIDEDEDGED